MKTFFITALLFVGIVSNTFGQKMDFSTYLANDGGVHSNMSFVTDKDGYIFIASGTREGLEVTDDAFQKDYKGHSNWAGGDIFLMKLSPEGELIYSTYIGGSANDYYAHKIATDKNGNIYVAFTTESTDLPVSKNAFQKSNKGNNDHYIIKFSNDCKYITSTYLGGSGGERFSRLACYKNSVYLIGITNSTDFPTTKGVFQEEYNNWISPDSIRRPVPCDITITALSPNLDRILYSTYLGGKSREYVMSYFFNEDGNFVLSGDTWSDDFPTSKKGFNRTSNGGRDGFLTIINLELSNIIYSTFLGGSADDGITSLVAYDANNILLAGSTESHDFPVTTDALNEKFLGGDNDGFIVKLNLESKDLKYSSFLGGSGSESFCYVTKTSDQKCVLAGRTRSANFPVTEHTFNRTINGEQDLVVLIMDETLKKIEYSTCFGGSKDEWFSKAKYINNGQLLISTASKSPDFPITNKYAEYDNTMMNILFQIDLNRKRELKN